MQLMKIFHQLFVLLQLCVFRVFRERVDNRSCQSDSALDNRQQVQKHRSEVETPLHLIHNKHDTFLLDGDLPQFTRKTKTKSLSLQASQMLIISKLQSPCLTLEGAVEVKERNLSENVVTVTVVTLFLEK